MLVLTRKLGERILLNVAGMTFPADAPPIAVTLLRVTGERARIGLEADRRVDVLREELADTPAE